MKSGLCWHFCRQAFAFLLLFSPAFFPGDEMAVFGPRGALPGPDLGAAPQRVKGRRAALVLEAAEPPSRWKDACSSPHAHSELRTRAAGDHDPVAAAAASLRWDFTRRPPGARFIPHTPGGQDWKVKVGGGEHRLMPRVG